jgi:hypothetical protein
MMMWATPAAPYLVEPVMRRAVYRLPLSHQVVASASRAREWSAERLVTVARYYSGGTCMPCMSG